MNVQNLAIATMTWARDARDESLLRSALTALAGFGTPVFVTDGGSGPEFIAFLRTLPRTTLCAADRPGPWPQVQASIGAAHASGAGHILYTEPDKAAFFTHVLPVFVEEASADQSVGAVLAARNAAEYATYPAFQRYTESVINRCCAEGIGEDIDFSYGPFVFSARIVPYLRHAADQVGWGWRQFAFAIARRLGLRVRDVARATGAPDAREAEDAQVKQYRMRQMTESVNGLLAGLRAPLTPDD